MHVEFGQPGDSFILSFKIRKTALAHRWATKVRVSQRLGYDIDDRRRFYGFLSRREDEKRALEHINQQIDIINDHRHLIERRLDSVEDQDTLNYLHNIFERYHGLLDQQDNEIWNNAPDAVRKALGLLNTAVHRCESVAHGNKPRTVVTYYNLPKKHQFDLQDYDLIEQYWKFGTVHICYVEIGKTLQDLSRDRDNYIGEDAFRPYTFYSADFVVRFSDSDPTITQQNIEETWAYYEQHRDWFESRGWNRNDPRLRPGIFPVADIQSSLSPDKILEFLRPRQYVNRVWFT